MREGFSEISKATFAFAWRRILQISRNDDHGGKLSTTQTNQEEFRLRQIENFSVVCIRVFSGIRSRGSRRRAESFRR